MKPSSADEGSAEQLLYKPHEKVIPKAVSGFFRRFKWQVMLVTLAIYYITPWIRWDRGAGAPDQAVLVDLANRRFYFFFIEIWPQEFYYVAGLLIMAGIGLFLITSTVGRAWCGYFCPQTVWTDLYLHIERFIEGDRNAQLRLNKKPWGAEKLFKRGSKHLSFILVAVATGGAWVFYFTDAPTLLMQLVTGTAPAVAYATIGVLTFTTYALGGLMREQVCIYMCPWPRIQGAMLDEKSLTVTYHDWRGEPRGKHRKSEEASALGDCIDCNACVNVCPMGIDIRDGQQLECITCALCIDACDEMMEKVGKPHGLVAYSTLEDYKASSQTKIQKHTTLRSLFKPRALIYTGLWAVVGIAMVVSLLIRDRLDVNVIHDRNPQYVMLSDGSIRNGFTMKILNMRLEERLFEITLEGLEGATIRQSGSNLPGARSLTLPVGADRVLEVKVFVEQPRSKVTGERQDFTIQVDDVTGPEQARYSAAFYAPE
ncbi:MAG: cytochrome c oxidase accessory protein CcoG [Neomegalonema sp.]|nr:cytochrome c oxidase accessory protein CcoG [Neomegalonema sp.]